MTLKIIQLEAKGMAGLYLGFLIFNVSALSSKCYMRTEGAMKDISSADLLWLERSKRVSALIYSVLLH